MANPGTQQNALSVAYVADPDEERPSPSRRFAARRALAATLTGLPERLLLDRARSEGRAHRRTEVVEEVAEPEVLAGI